MPRKTRSDAAYCAGDVSASMRPRPDAAENDFLVENFANTAKPLLQ